MGSACVATVAHGTEEECKQESRFSNISVRLDRSARCVSVNVLCAAILASSKTIKGLSSFHGSESSGEQTINSAPLRPTLRAAMATLPVSREQYLADMTTLKDQMATVKTAVNVEQMVQLSIPV